ncbi:amine GPCR [Clonorchis sinensis]|uniref:Amine GPCR n=1 Tax=Clonorchis sinensis TaxID=79923 RepID=G7YRQ1_CLOSI|nr:amine GPCR [Clonorchis sinensis]
MVMIIIDLLGCGIYCSTSPGFCPVKRFGKCTNCSKFFKPTHDKTFKFGWFLKFRAYTSRTTRRLSERLREHNPVSLSGVWEKRCTVCVWDLIVIGHMIALELQPTCVRVPQTIWGYLLCHIWFSRSTFWFSVLMSELNLVGISLDRLLAVTSPLMYRNRQITLSVVIYVGSAIYSIALVSPRLLDAVLNGTMCCFTTSNHSHIGFHRVSLYPYIWVIFSYVVPFSVILSAHWTIILMLKHSRCRTSETEETSHHSCAVSIATITPRTVRTIRTLHKYTGAMAVLFLVTRSTAVVRYLLSTSNIFSSPPDSIFYKMSIRLTVFGICLNPVLLFFTVPLIRDLAVENCKTRFRRKLGYTICVNLVPLAFYSWPLDLLSHCLSTSNFRNPVIVFTSRRHRSLIISIRGLNDSFSAITVELCTYVHGFTIYRAFSVDSNTLYFICSPVKLWLPLLDKICNCHPKIHKNDAYYCLFVSTCIESFSELIVTKNTNFSTVGIDKHHDVLISFVCYTGFGASGPLLL